MKKNHTRSHWYNYIVHERNTFFSFVRYYCAGSTRISTINELPPRGHPCRRHFAQAILPSISEIFSSKAASLDSRSVQGFSRHG